MVDAKDKKILGVLLGNSRLSYRQIAKRLGMSAATVMIRIKRLEDEKIIRYYTANLDYEKVGYDIHIIIDLRISKGKLLGVGKKIASHPNVIGVYDTTGPFDTTILARFKSKSLMDRFLKKIQTYDFVERTETKLVLNTIKESNLEIR